MWCAVGTLEDRMTLTNVLSILRLILKFLKFTCHLATPVLHGQNQINPIYIVLKTIPLTDLTNKCLLYTSNLFQLAINKSKLFLLTWFVLKYWDRPNGISECPYSRTWHMRQLPHEKLVTPFLDIALKSMTLWLSNLEQFKSRKLEGAGLYWQAIRVARNEGWQPDIEGWVRGTVKYTK